MGKSQILNRILQPISENQVSLPNNNELDMFRLSIGWYNQDAHDVVEKDHVACCAFYSAASNASSD